MISPELVALHTQVEAAQQGFTIAVAAYQAASANQAPASIRMQAAQRCRAAGEHYALTLAILLAYFDQHDADAHGTAERERIQRLRATVQRDLALLPDPA